MKLAASQFGFFFLGKIREFPIPFLQGECKCEISTSDGIRAMGVYSEGTALAVEPSSGSGLLQSSPWRPGCSGRLSHKQGSAGAGLTCLWINADHSSSINAGHPELPLCISAHAVGHPLLLLQVVQQSGAGCRRGTRQLSRSVSL